MCTGTQVLQTALTELRGGAELDIGDSGIVAAASAVILASVAYVVRSHHARPSSSGGRAMLAILPFQNLSNDPAQEYFSDGLTEETITDLGQLSPVQLGVIARTSAMAYKHTNKTISQIGRELGVDYILEGSVRKDGRRARISAQLIRVSDQTHLWARNYDVDLKDLIEVQNDLGKAIVEQIQIALSEQARERFSGTRQVDPQAYEEYLQGLELLNLRTAESLLAAIVHFDRATEIAPDYALAYAAKAQCYSLLPVFGAMKATLAMPKAREAALEALRLDDSLSSAHTALAFVKAHYEYDWSAADREFRRGIELNPSDTMGHLFYSNSYLSPHRRHGEAILEMQKAIALDPLSMPVQAFLIRSYTWARRWDDAIAQFNTVNAFNPNVAIIHMRRSRLYECSAQYYEAIDENLKARVLSGERPDEAFRKANITRKAVAERGARGYWETLLEFSRDKENPPESYVSPFGIAILRARLGEKDEAIEALNRAYEDRDFFLTEIAVEPAFDTLRDDSKFRKIQKRVGL